MEQSAASNQERIRSVRLSIKRPILEQQRPGRSSAVAMLVSIASAEHAQGVENCQGSSKR